MTKYRAVLAALLLVGCGAEGPDDWTEPNDALHPSACEEPFPVPEGCEEAACEMARCGEPDSFLDEFRCERKRCETEADCGPSEECRWLRYLHPSCGYLQEGGACSCGSNLMNIDSQLCLPKQ